MRHYVPLQDNKGNWTVAYGNHRGEFIAVMECPSLEVAYNESEAMTLDATKAAICGTGANVIPSGNRYLRKFA